ncbi:hypothetical protein FOL47_008462 [Perkinsus chesapeaki]|uniref:LicD/FKTN/FKRP nucleotidyltransferase domain-containing protein n=1 Tax=Perkinsus chesapeaki TaxID=330153 RepID=A0A7J6LDS3_PERCH|nr:hypothetical protein FOL47_008462 [Perkinsus chesapeaki]
MMLNLSWLLLSPLLAPKFELGTRPQVIRVWNETELQHADLDDIFLCPKQTVSYLRKSSGWPKSDLYIDGRKCLRTSEIQAANSDRLECVAKVTGFTSELLSNLGLDAFITDGTLLGWFRHNGGQIPWDLDGDIGVLRSQCTQAVSDGGVEGISDIIKDKLPPGYFLYAIDEDHVVHSNPSGSEFKQCDVPELRVGSTVNDQWCHTDIYISIDDEDDICLRKGVCFKKDVLLPLKNSSLVEKFAVEVPARPEDVLAVLYRKHPGSAVESPLTGLGFMASLFSCLSLFCYVPDFYISCVQFVVEK